MLTIIVLDVRTLEHPVPFEKAVAAFHALKPDEVLHMIHRKNPVPLLELLEKNRASYKNCHDANGVWHIYISKQVAFDFESFDVCQ